MKNKLINFIETNQLREKKLLLAVSGGIDSMAMLHLFSTLQTEFNLNLAVCHLDHKLRMESKAEQDFVETISQNHRIEFYGRSIDVTAYMNAKKLSLEMAAHDLRYQTLIEVANQSKSDFIVTAHHFDDQIETVFMRLGFGTGIEGVQGLSSRNNRFLKPFLDIKKSEIEDYVKHNSIQFKTDLSNSNNQIARNYWRNEIIPKITDRFGTSYLDKVIDSVKNLNWSERDQELINTIISEQHLDKNRCEFNKVKLLGFPDSFIKVLIERLIQNQFRKTIQLNKTQFQQLIQILRSKNSGKKLVLNNIISFESSFDNLLICAIEQKKDHVYLINAGEQIHLDHFDLTVELVEKANMTELPSVEYADASRMKFPLTIRQSRSGDVFYPIGLAGKQTVNRHLKSKRVDADLRKDFWLICDRDSVIWLIGERLDKRYALTNESKMILKMEIINRN